MPNMRKILCPFCHDLQILIGQNGSKKLLACGHRFLFKKTKSQKDMARKYVRTEYGLEKVSENEEK